MGTPETSREPCPDRILDDLGGAFAMGAVGGTAFHFLKGLHNSPNGRRLAGASTAVRLNAPRVGGGFAVWGGLFSLFDCSFVYARQKEDPWNSILSGAATGGFLSLRHGAGPVARSAVFGGVILALIEGAGIMLNRLVVVPQELPPSVLGEGSLPTAMAGASSGGVGGGFQGELGSGSSGSDSGSSSSWFGGLFGGSKEGSGGGKSEVLESFDTPSAAIPSFEFK